MNRKDPILCIVGLGYVGLPLAAAFGKTGWKTYGYDLNAKRIETLKAGHDWTNELSEKQLKETAIDYSTDPAVIAKANTIIVAVPTPVDAKNKPDLSPLVSSSTTIGKYLQKGSVVVYEATVYPGVTEEICAPILERESKLVCGKDFTVGYSPERINPGDKEHTVDKIVKIVAGQDAETTIWLEKVYGNIVTAGIHRAQNIKVAELAKALENTQRDINIALMNEVAKFCDLLGIRTQDVLKAAGTKWNFLKFTPGLVGGHCIGVDPYYLVEKAKELGLTTEVISAGRKINDSMASFVASQIVRSLKSPKNANVLVLGLTFKENIPDTRNSKSHDLIQELESAGCTVKAHDPELTVEQITKLGFTNGSLEDGSFEAIVVAVPHAAYVNKLLPADFIRALTPSGTFYDLKSIWNAGDFESKGIRYLSL